jgi:formylglycine-generating enzyme required for sulfatase activity/tRNA A-37 threonylcarbamoyl transferase component Bud32
MLAKGTILAERYEILRDVKSGGQGAVYEAYDAKLKCRVAVKRTVAATEKMRNALEREALTLAQLRHRHLPRVTDHFPHPDYGHFLVMDFIDGDDLGAIVENEKLPVARTLRWAHQLLDVVAYLHGFKYEDQPKPIIHCDIKPLNLKLTKDDDIVLLDFGLASGLPTAIAGSRLRTALGGTSGYMPYEQEQRLYEPGDDPNEKWDVYAVGATLYHLLTGFPPSPSGARAFKTSRQKPDPLEPPHKKNPRQGIPEAVSAVVMRAMALDADDRFATIGEFRTALRAAEKGEAIAPGWTEGFAAPAMPAIVIPKLAASFVNAIGMEFVLVSAGKFRMGSNEYEDEKPIHAVTIGAPFYMGKYQVTQGEWAAVMGSNPSGFKGDDRLPVERVSWDDCQEFIKRLNARKDGYVYRLPSEAEWEYACRAGTTTPFSFGETLTTAQANYDGNFPYGDGPKGEYRNKTTRVGSFPPNAWGLHDMHGNVWEWCQDGWHENYDGAPTDGATWEQGSDNQRVVRGGSWVGAVSCRAANRNRDAPVSRNDDVGVRVAVRLATN